MPTRLCRTGLVTAALVAATTVTGCSTGRHITTIAATERTYDYYPDQEVYVDQTRGLYFWRDARGWRSARALPADIRVDSSRAIAVPLRTDTPHKLHASVRSAYPPSGVARAHP